MSSAATLLTSDLLRLLRSPDSKHVVCLQWAVAAAAVGYGIYATLRLRKRHVNECLKKECDKVVDSVDMEDLGDKAVFCRCWRSKKFPYCDGAHNQHNAATGDNVGPLVVKKKAN